MLAGALSHGVSYQMEWKRNSKVVHSLFQKMGTPMMGWDLFALEKNHEFVVFYLRKRSQLSSTISMLTQNWECLPSNSNHPKGVA